MLYLFCGIAIGVAIGWFITRACASERKSVLELMRDESARRHGFTAKMAVILLMLSFPAFADVPEPDCHIPEVFVDPLEVKLDSLSKEMKSVLIQLENMRIDEEHKQTQKEAAEFIRNAEEKPVKIGVVYASGLMGLWGLATGGVYPTITGIIYIAISYTTATTIGD